jgi:hypothetical protein
MAAGQNDAAMIDFRQGCAFLAESGPGLTLHHRASAGGTPVGWIAVFQNRVTLAANAFHAGKHTGSSRGKSRVRWLPVEQESAQNISGTV